MSDKFEKILNECIDLVNKGESIGDCISRYPEHADELQSLLESMLLTKSPFVSIPTASAKQRARQRMVIALNESEGQRSRSRFAFPSIFRNAKALAAAAAVLVIALAGYFGVTLITSPQIVPAIASDEGNFALLISDAPNAIDDFTSLTMMVSKIRLKTADDSRKWIEIDTEDTMVDLVLLQEDNALEIWRGVVPAGEYTEAVLYSDSVNGVLESSENTISIKLPAGRLSLKMVFIVGEDAPTEFVYDITVNPAETGSGQYILTPNASKSGTAQPFQRVDNQGNNQDQGQGQGQGQN